MLEHPLGDPRKYEKRLEPYKNYKISLSQYSGILVYI